MIFGNTSGWGVYYLLLFVVFEFDVAWWSEES